MESNLIDLTLSEIIKTLDISGEDRDVWPLHRVCASENISELIYFLDNEYYDIDCRDSDGQTALHRAAYSDNHTLISYLIYYGATVKTYDNNGFTPLDIAKFWKNYNVIDMIKHYF